MQAFSLAVASRNFVAICRLLIEVASLAVEILYMDMQALVISMGGRQQLRFLGSRAKAQ